MVRRNALDALYQEVNTDLFELINLIEIKIDVSYILEELEDVIHKVRKINKVGDPIVSEMEHSYDKLYKKYQNKLASFLSSKECRKLVETLSDWIRRLPMLF